MPWHDPCRQARARSVGLGEVRNERASAKVACGQWRVAPDRHSEDLFVGPRPRCYGA
jgi:hypothetical protein